jgi:hypothetical protein
MKNIDFDYEIDGVKVYHLGFNGNHYYYKRCTILEYKDKQIRISTVGGFLATHLNREIHSTRIEDKYLPLGWNRYCETMVFNEKKSGYILDEDIIESKDWNPNIKTHANTEGLDQMHRMIVRKWIHMIQLPLIEVK